MKGRMTGKKQQGEIPVKCPGATENKSENRPEDGIRGSLDKKHLFLCVWSLKGHSEQSKAGTALCAPKQEKQHNHAVNCIYTIDLPTSEPTAGGVGGAWRPRGSITPSIQTQLSSLSLLLQFLVSR